MNHYHSNDDHFNNNNNNNNNDSLQNNIVIPKNTSTTNNVSDSNTIHSKYAHYYSYSWANKAGMDNMDREKQSQIIYEMSNNSAFFKRGKYI